ncbi:MAG TPA: hypothetical protein VHE10_00165 [Candidatus Paceibacterota bacterium]|nr:hypothetical protein [Candidatus Paceibacterota bacterium]
MNRMLFFVLAAMVLSAIGANFYTFYYEKDYDFLVEAPCDASAHTCFVRECDDGDCPPNDLSSYREFHVKAADFGSCADDTCAAECESGKMACEERICDTAAGDACSSAE